MLALPEGGKPRPVDRRVLANAPPAAFDPIHGSRLSLPPRPPPDSETASSVYSYVDTAPIGFVLCRSRNRLHLQYKNSVKMRTALVVPRLRGGLQPERQDQCE